MNIFVTDKDPIIAANLLDDKRVVKMILESTQMLCTAINELSGTQIAPYKSTHKNHPSNVWVRESRTNWYWLLNHALALCSVYTKVYGKHHKCEKILTQLKNEELAACVPEGPLTTFANCAAHQGKGLSFKHVTEPTEAYKQYLAARWASDVRQPTWTNREKPSWI